DAFQAVFLVLSRKAGSLHWKDSVRGWLFEAASRVARQARAKRLVRQRHELQAREQSQTVSEPEISLRELRAVLDEELLRLPEKYRLPLLLCCAKGATRDQ